MNKKTITIISVVVVLLLCCGVGVLYYNLSKQKKENVQMQQLAEMDKKEMENEYSQFASQYGELKMQINNDSIIAQLDREQQRTESLLSELRKVKASDAAEITRLKKELVTVRAVMRGYILEIDSLNRLNKNLTAENQQVKAKYSEATQQISTLTSEKQNLSDKVAVAAQLDATNINVMPKNKRGKVAKKVKDVKRIAVSFTITKNITAEAGNRTIYIRITQPNNDVLSNGGSFNYENRSLPYSIKKVIEYTGEEQTNTVYWDVNEFLSAGTYHVYIFAGGSMIGSSSFVLK
jgi:hypothetical protein